MNAVEIVMKIFLLFIKLCARGPAAILSPPVLIYVARCRGPQSRATPRYIYWKNKIVKKRELQTSNLFATPSVVFRKLLVAHAKIFEPQAVDQEDQIRIGRSLKAGHEIILM